ncbi:MAG: 50S ribosomal protein L25/general stress protein Ctc [Gammaproteobacteria bacterium]
MSNQFELAADIRSDVGKGASRRLRRLEDKVPAIVYGGGEDPQNLLLEHRIVSKALQNEAFYSHILTLIIDGKKQKAVLKDVQRHPYKPRIMHVDFLRITGKEKLHMNVPVHYRNEAQAPGVMAGGVVHTLHHIEVVCSPADLPEFIEIDLGSLELNGVIHLSEVKLPKGVEAAALQHGDDMSVASIHMPRIVAEDVEVEAAETPVEGEEAAAEGETSPETPAAPDNE